MRTARPDHRGSPAGWSCRASADAASCKLPALGAAAAAAVGAQRRTGGRQCGRPIGGASALPKGWSGTIADLKHVVILMQENRSFDHYFGTLRGVRGFGDKQVLT